MKTIDWYIEQVKLGNIAGGERRTKAYPFVDDGVILVNKFEEDFEKKKIIIDYCKRLNINIPALIDFKNSDDDYWILEELAPGVELDYLVKEDRDIVKKVPYEHMEKYINDCYLLELNGIGIEPRYRNILYDFDKGFTTIDVALLPQTKNLDSLESVEYFFKMFFPVFKGYSLHPSDTELAFKILKAFENGHPFFNKYKRWIYRNYDNLSSILLLAGVDLTLDENEQQTLLAFINKLIEDIAFEIVENPAELENHRKLGYIQVLESSIKYCPDFNLYDPTEQDLEKYIYSSANNIIKSMFLRKSDDSNLKELYFRIRREEIDPVNKYTLESVNRVIEEELIQLQQPTLR